MKGDRILAEGLPTGIQLYRILDIMRGYKASNPRDLVYAYLAMIKAGHPELQVDYRKSVVEVWVETAKFLIKELPWGHHLNIISWCECTMARGDKEPPKDTMSTYEGLPSWVPDLHFRSMPQTFPKDSTNLDLEAGPFYAAGIGPIWTNTGNSTLNLRPTFENNPLVISAFAVGKVVDLQLFLSLDSLEDIYEPTGEKKEDAFLRLVVGDANLNVHGAVDGRGGSVIPPQDRSHVARTQHQEHVYHVTSGRQFGRM